MQKTNKNNTISIPLFVVILAIMVVLTLFFSIKTICFGNNDSEEIEQVEEQVEEPQEEVQPEPVEEPKQEEVQASTETPEQVEEPQTENKVQTYTASDGKTYESIGSINIPRLGINYPILSTTTDKLLKVSVTKYWGGNPNEVGNLCITGHNYKNSKFFGKLPNIQNGDIIQITDLNGKTLDYTVYNTYVVDPEDTSCTSQLTDGKIEVTLITCYYENGNAHATKRLIVKARVQ